MTKQEAIKKLLDLRKQLALMKAVCSSAQSTETSNQPTMRIEIGHLGCKRSNLLR
jgi:hypothetical protein